MGDKIVDTRFTLQFSRTDPTHLQVAEILNRQGRRSKAQYIVNAVLHYENCNETPNMQRSAGFDEKIIEAVVYRILRDQAEDNVDKPAAAVTTSRQAKKPVRAAEDISYDEAVEALGEEGLNAVAGAMDMFRKK
jgi:hypothetical protein